MIYESELYHHGIKGQRWGKRNGPPYPLDKKISRKEYKKSAKDVKKTVDKKYQILEKEEELDTQFNDLDLKSRSGRYSQDIIKDLCDKYDKDAKRFYTLQKKSYDETRSILAKKYGEEYVNSHKLKGEKNVDMWLKTLKDVSL